MPRNLRRGIAEGFGGLTSDRNVSPSPGRPSLSGDTQREYMSNSYIFNIFYCPFSTFLERPDFRTKSASVQPARGPFPTSRTRLQECPPRAKEDEADINRCRLRPCSVKGCARDAPYRKTDGSDP